MNEIALIRAQLAAEKSHLTAVAEACLAALESGRGADQSAAQFRNACADYMERGLSAFEARDQRLADLTAQAGTDETSHQALGRALALPGSSREALEKLNTARANPAALPAWNTCVQYLLHQWKARRDSLDALLAANNRVSEWRAIGGIDADSILAERRGYRGVNALLPSGITLPPTAATGEPAR
jgi:hypothetical protein